MASHTPERAGNTAGKAADQVKDAASSVARSAGDAVDAKREKVADAIDDAAETVDEKGKRAPEPAKRYARVAKDKLHGAADYVRDNEAEQMGRDAIRTVNAYPVATLLVLGAVVIGGSILVAAMLDDEQADNGSGQGRRPLGLSSASSGLGPKGAETLTKIRDAAFSFALAKAVDTVDEMWPGFREHYERG